MSVRKALGDETSESAQRFATRDVLGDLARASFRAYAAAAEALVEAIAGTRRCRNLATSVALDPTFGLGYAGTWRSRPESRQAAGRGEAYIKEAVRHLDSMTERERAIGRAASSTT